MQSFPSNNPAFNVPNSLDYLYRAISLIETNNNNNNNQNNLGQFEYLGNSTSKKRFFSIS
jgi:hypothetical protein